MQLSTQLRVSRYPCVAVLASTRGRAKMVQRLEGWRSPTDLVAGLRRGQDAHAAQQAAEVAQTQQQARVLPPACACARATCGTRYLRAGPSTWRGRAMASTGAEAKGEAEVVVVVVVVLGGHGVLGALRALRGARGLGARGALECMQMRMRDAGCGMRDAGCGMRMRAGTADKTAGAWACWRAEAGRAAVGTKTLRCARFSAWQRAAAVSRRLVLV